MNQFLEGPTPLPLSLLIREGGRGQGGGVPTINPVNDSEITIIKAGDVIEAYKNLDEALSQIAFFKPIPLLNYEPQDRFSLRNWLSNLKLSSRIPLYRMPHGSNFDTINFA